MEARRGAIGLLLLACAAPAPAHDSWLVRSRTAGAGISLELTTGNRYPLGETGVAAASIAQARCRDGSGRSVPLKPVERSPRWLDLRSASRGAKAPMACWAGIKPAEIAIEPELVQVYFDEIRAPAEVRERWAQLQARGIGWRESYGKSARIEIDAPHMPAQQRAAARAPAGLPLEIVVLGDAPVRAGESALFQLLRDGRPLAGFPIELVSERGRFGVWQQTDAQGQLRHVLPFKGAWLLRGTEVRAAGDDRWDSRFVTLAFEAY